MPIEIDLTKGQKALVCDCCHHKVAGKKWRAMWSKANKSYYAQRAATLNEIRNGSPSTIMMHREIKDAPPGLVVDHIHHNTLDNRCSELRVVTVLENNNNPNPKRWNDTAGYTLGWTPDMKD